MFNLVHATAAPPTTLRGPNPLTRKISEKIIFAIAVIPLFYLAFLGARNGLSPRAELPAWVHRYASATAIIGISFILRWCYRSVTRTLPKGAEKISTSRENVQSLFSESLYSGFKGRVFERMPFNQSVQLTIDRWDFSLPHLPSALQGFRICQLSDLHLTGIIKQEYFQHVVDRVLRASPDLIVVTGDIIDEYECLDWIDETLAGLTAPHGVYYILGNHDLIVPNQQELRGRLQDAGLIMANDSNWHRIGVGDANILLAGNELPWYRGAERLPPPDAEIPNPFLILLTHSPDQVGWAVNRNFDLVFAGHTHGCQIRLPVVGPIIAPSRYGIKYASGTFQLRRTLMHVSRGISGDEPIRINCPPEIGIFTLKRQTAY